MSWTPSGTWKRNFRNALKSGYPIVYAMELMLGDYFNTSLANIAPVGPGVTYEYQLFQLTAQAEMEDWLVDLVAAAHERRPKNQALREIAEELGLTLTGPRLDNRTGTPFQEIIRENAHFITLDGFVDRLAALQGQVCWVDIPGGGGTGFLVGPDLVLTNHHVIKRLTDGRASPDDVKCLFDYRKAIEDTSLTRKKVTEVKLKTGDWLKDSLPASEFDWTPSLGDASENELDYGLIQLAETVGELPVGGDTADMVAADQPRGWIDTNVTPPPLTAGNQIFLLQHPKGEPLQLSIGEVTKFNGNGTRLRYNANSKDGSSGSPCFNADLQLVALHHAYDFENRPPEWNQAIPFGKIRQQGQIGALPTPP